MDDFCRQLVYEFECYGYGSNGPHVDIFEKLVRVNGGPGKLVLYPPRDRGNGRNVIIFLEWMSPWVVCIPIFSARISVSCADRWLARRLAKIAEYLPDEFNVVGGFYGFRWPVDDGIVDSINGVAESIRCCCDVELDGGSHPISLRIVHALSDL